MCEPLPEKFETKHNIAKHNAEPDDYVARSALNGLGLVSGVADIVRDYARDRAALMEFRAACESGDLDYIRRVAAEYKIAGADMGFDRGTAFYALAGGGNVDAVEWASRSLPNPSTTTRYPLLMGTRGRHLMQAACGRGHLDMAQWLAKFYNPTADDIRFGTGRFPPLCSACVQGHLAVARWVVDHFQLTAADVFGASGADADPVMVLASRNGHTDIVEWLDNTLRGTTASKYNAGPVFDLTPSAARQLNMTYLVALNEACLHGKLPTAQKLSQLFVFPLAEIFKSTLRQAVRGGESVLKWLLAAYHLAQMTRAPGFEDKNLYNSGYQALAIALKRNDLSLAKFLTDELDLANPNTRDTWLERTDILCAAARGGSVELMEWTIATFGLRGRDVRGDTNQVLLEACVNGHLEQAQWLTKTYHLYREDAKEDRIFEETCKSGHLDTAKWLHAEFKLGAADLAGSFADICAAGDVDMVTWLLSTFRQELSDRAPSAVMLACQEGRADVARLLLEAFEYEALNHLATIACTAGQLDVLKMLSNKKQVIPLKLAAEHYETDIIQWLLDTREYSDAEITEAHVVVACCRWGDIEQAQWVCAKYHSPLDEILDSLSAACTRDHPDIVRWLASKVAAPQAAELYTKVKSRPDAIPQIMNNEAFAVLRDIHNIEK